MILKYYIAFFITIFSSASQQIEHEFHLSKCDIHYSKDDSALQISLRIFIDDLEAAIAQVLKEENLKLCTDKEIESADSIMVAYLKTTFKITVDENLSDLQYVGKEVSEDLLAVWCYFEIPDISPQENIQVENKILIETFEDQSNMVSMKYSKEKKEHFMFQKGNTSGVLELN